MTGASGSVGLAAAALLLAAGAVAGQGGEDGRRRIALTYDDLPVNAFRPDERTMREVTRELVSGLVRNGVPAIGFVNEGKLYQEGELRKTRVGFLEAWVEAGLELGNHSFSHPDLHNTPLEAYERDVLRGEEVTRRVLAAAGMRPRFFRHPFLHTGRDIETRDAFTRFLHAHGYRVAPVTIDNQEWIFARAYDHALARAEPALAGRIVEAYLAYMQDVLAYYERQSRAILGYEVAQVMLLHANRLNAATTDRLVRIVRGRGYEIVPLERALEDPAYGHADEYAGAGGITWLHRWALTDGRRGDFFAGEPEVPAFVQAAYDDPPRMPQPASSDR